jgi:hypothetical protein
VNPDSLSITLRPRSLAETADLALLFLVRHVQQYWFVSTLCLVVPAVAFYAISLHLGGFTTWLLVYLWAWLVEGIFVQLGAELLFGNRITTGKLLLTVLRRAWPYFIAMTVTQLWFAVQACTLILLPRGYSRMALFPEVILLEGLRGEAALGRCARLGRLFERRLGGLLGLSILIVVLVAILVEILGQVLFVLFMIPGTPPGDLFEQGISLASILGVLGVVPLLGTTRLFVYVGERARQDGWDVQLRFQGILARESELS